MKVFRIVTLVAGLVLLCESAFALGLGDIEIRSYLGQPISGRIELISYSPQELATVTAKLAAASDYEFVGMKQNLSVPLRFVVDADLSRPGIEVTSRLPVTDPVIQFVVEVSWSGGRMLKEYTVFLDPPTIAASAPAPAVFTRRVADQPEYPDPAQLDVVETIKPQAAIPPQPQPEPSSPAALEQVQSDAVEDGVTEQAGEQAATTVAPGPEAVAVTPAVTVPADHLAVEDRSAEQHDAEPQIEDSSPVRQDMEAQSPVESASIPDETAESVANPAQDIPADTAATDIADAVQPEPSAQVSQPTAAVASSSRPPISASFQNNSEPYGPVQRGDTLWSIALRYIRGSDFSINQAMLAIQRLNPDAFGGNNINSLKAGVVLRMPAAAEISRMTQRQAMLEAIRQEQAYAAIRAGLPYDDTPPVLADLDMPVSVADIADAQAPLSSMAPEDEGRLELVPPLEGQGQSTGGGDSDSATGAISSEELSETLARTEEELVNAQQENEYLSQRIRELEAQLEQGGGTVVSNEMAEMEASLREDRLSGDEQATSVVRQAERKAWYQGKLAWFVGGALLLVALVVWQLRRIGTPGTTETDVPDAGDPSSAVLTLRTEAEEILDTLDGESEEPAGSDDKVIDLDERSETVTKSSGPFKGSAGPAEDSEVIELDTSDPETRLDLARAYISMNDPEMARQMLEEVLETGDDDQVREARDMMRELKN